MCRVSGKASGFKGVCSGLIMAKVFSRSLGAAIFACGTSVSSSETHVFVVQGIEV